MQMSRKLLPLLIIMISLFPLNAQVENQVKSKSYCTEIGRFDLLFDSDEIAGSYLLKHKNALGGIWGKLEGHIMTGRWLDADGQGDIILTFNDDYSFFAADYRADDEPEKWYKNTWHGALRPDDKAVFTREDKTYTCE